MTTIQEAEPSPLLSFAVLDVGRTLVSPWDRALGCNDALAEGYYYLAPAETPTAAGRPRAGSDATSLNTSGAAERAPPEEATRPLTGVGLPPLLPPHLSPISLAPPDPVWPARAQRPRGHGSR